MRRISRRARAQASGRNGPGSPLSDDGGEGFGSVLREGVILALRPARSRWEPRAPAPLGTLRFPGALAGLRAPPLPQPKPGPGREELQPPGAGSLSPPSTASGPERDEGRLSRPNRPTAPRPALTPWPAAAAVGKETRKTEPQAAPDGRPARAAPWRVSALASPRSTPARRPSPLATFLRTAGSRWGVALPYPRFRAGCTGE